MAQNIDTKTSKVVPPKDEPKGKQPDDRGVIQTTIRIMKVK